MIHFASSVHNELNSSWCRWSNKSPSCCRERANHTALSGIALHVFTYLLFQTEVCFCACELCSHSLCVVAKWYILHYKYLKKWMGIALLRTRRYNF